MTEQQLLTELARAYALPLTQSPDARAVVLENQDYRFLLMDGALQSILDRHHPQRLLFPHQQLYQRFLRQLGATAQVLELGLGGASLARYGCHHQAQLKWLSIENESQIIAALDYFACPQQLTVMQTDAAVWLLQPVQQRYDFIHVDVFTAAEVPAWLLLPQFTNAIVQRLCVGGVLAFNLIETTASADDTSQRLLKLLPSSWHWLCKRNPGYRNCQLLVSAEASALAPFVDDNEH
ncbi:fused MFS/spermidine synthase [Idiomarina xiamenensis]|uniref:Spermidine synthase n=1 Tax=Idiomarina xiamenensis 10-D-4 TaxID=740709 RepID=K2JC67_9GAMM|nr:fused MFS/spermidine synthase [Idiomarina xiamenensis]EKE80906.1 spermidine synthase [Idiomarina xiamenensis 10-D-4]